MRGSTRPSGWTSSRARASTCCAWTEYRVIARASLRPVGLRTAVAAGEALNAEIVGTWLDGANVLVRDGYGQTETGAATGVAPGAAARPGSMGRRQLRGELDDARVLVRRRLALADGERQAAPSRAARPVGVTAPDRAARAAWQPARLTSAPLEPMLETLPGTI
jgi:hypothetical protein